MCFRDRLRHVSTYCFGLMVVLCILVQMNYFNRALDQFSTNVVNPIYYVMFTTSTILASVLLFQGFDTTNAAAVSLLGGFVVTFLGVYLLNANAQAPASSADYERIYPDRDAAASFVIDEPTQSFPLTPFHDQPAEPARSP